ncbi:MAG: C1 family peptidase [Rhodocyclaceae bacterium]|nr:C1 family peptidase [Rhodocyclaceae bacterium]
MTKPRKAKPTAAKQAQVLDAVPDRIDLRDWMYQPTLSPLPVSLVNCGKVPEILDQGREGACTGFALAAVINFLAAQRSSARRVSPRMLYEMARKYDEWPGEDYEGSSARGAMKGWMRHGVTTRELWPDKLAGANHLGAQRARDALQSPGGAYFRVAHRQVRDVHAALAEVGAVYVTLMVHDGWGAPAGAAVKLTDERSGQTFDLPVIVRRGRASGGHAIALVGYGREGFVVQNSWGTDWGAGGFALLPYEDFMLHATDVWVAQLGVPVACDLWTQADTDGDLSSGLQRATPALPLAQLRPYIIDIGNNGKLSDSGQYWTTLDDLKRMVQEEIPRQTAGWSKRRVMLYLHGGLNSEKDGAKRCTAMLGKALRNEIYPVHVLWETGFMETVGSYFGDWLSNAAKLSGRSLFDTISDGRDYVVERSLAGALQAVWGEMKENAEGASKRNGAMQLLADVLHAAGDPKDWELHVVAHSAGSIFFAHLLKLIVANKLPLKSVQFMAPAATVDLFKTQVLPQVTSKACPRPTMYVLTQDDELDDTVGGKAVYGKSLLYLVSNACEPRRKTPILGMDNFVQGDADLKKLWPKGGPDYILSGSATCQSSSHGGFDNDAPTMNEIMRRILGTAPKYPFTPHDLRY